jgi:TRAP-type C4-dicarboxylate transport system substrate-binding protein
LRKSILIVLLAIALLCIPLMASCTPQSTQPAQPAEPTQPAQPAETIKLNYADFFPPSNWHSILAKLWCDEIQKQTGGRVEITYYPGGSLAAANKIADAVETGIADVGMSCTAYTVGRFPASELIDMPHAYPNGWTSTMVANDFLNKFQLPEWDKVHLLYFHAHGPSVIFTTKVPVRKLEDVKGLVLRSTGIGAQIVEALGGSGYAAGQGDAYDLMSKGTVDGSYTPREVLKGWNQAEVVKYVTDTTAIGSCAGFYICMNNDKWNALPKDIQDIFTKVSADWIEKHAMVWTAYDKVAIDYFLTFPDREVINLDAAETAKFVNAAKPALTAYLAERRDKGLPVDEYEAYITERVPYWADKSPSDQECIDWVDKNVVPYTPAPATK